MTTLLHIAPIWLGETVAVLGNAPCLDEELATLARPIHAIAVNQAAAKAPWADMMVSIDANWSGAAEDFPGMRIVGFESDTLDAHFVHFPHEEVQVAPGKTLHIRANLLAAIRVAAQAGAAKILLLGIDSEYYEKYLNAPGTVQGLANLVDEMRGRGVEVERYRAPAPVDDALSTTTGQNFTASARAISPS